MKTKNFLIIVLALFLMLFLGGALIAADMSSTSFSISGSNMNGGGNIPTATDGGAGSFKIGTSQGQSSPIGESGSTSFGNGAGFWYVSLPPDSDGDGVPDALDNCPDVSNSDQADGGDGDGVGDLCDNCTLVANVDQRDTNGDLYGNLCDPDLDNNGAVGISDFGLFKTAFGTADSDADFDGNGAVGISDFGIFKNYFGSPPGPSGLVP